MQPVVQRIPGTLLPNRVDKAGRGVNGQARRNAAEAIQHRWGGDYTVGDRVIHEAVIVAAVRQVNAVVHIINDDLRLVSLPVVENLVGRPIYTIGRGGVERKRFKSTGLNSRPQRVDAPVRFDR